MKLKRNCRRLDDEGLVTVLVLALVVVAGALLWANVQALSWMRQESTRLEEKQLISRPGEMGHSARSGQGP